MGKDIALFYYYSMLPFPTNCYLHLNQEIAYRNMFPIPCAGNKIHFEFPMFENHSYNSICNCDGMKSLIKKMDSDEKYIVFRTKNTTTNKCNIIGYYKVSKCYFQRTNMFDNNGFVWGIESDEQHLVKRDTIVYDKNIGRNYRLSWKINEWGETLNKFIELIKKEENISDLYQVETKRLINIFKNEDKISEWRNACDNCVDKKKCGIYIRFKRYTNLHPEFDMFKLIHKFYTTELYSKNKLDTIEKEYLFGG